MGDYERLEFLGDALLDFVVLSHLYVRNPKWDPGRLTAEKTAMVGNQFLAWVATDRLSVYKYVIEFGEALSEEWVLGWMCLCDVHVSLNIMVACTHKCALGFTRNSFPSFLQTLFSVAHNIIHPLPSLQIAHALMHSPLNQVHGGRRP